MPPNSCFITSILHNVHCTKPSLTIVANLRLMPNATYKIQWKIYSGHNYDY